MSDTKKPKLSEIRARNERARKHGRYHYRPAASRALFTEIPYLLDLVERIGERLRIASPYVFRGCNCPDCKEARALLKELKQ